MNNDVIYNTCHISIIILINTYPINLDRLDNIML